MEQLCWICHLGNISCGTKKASLIFCYLSLVLVTFRFCFRIVRFFCSFVRRSPLICWWPMANKCHASSPRVHILCGHTSHIFHRSKIHSDVFLLPLLFLSKLRLTAPRSIATWTGKPSKYEYVLMFSNKLQLGRTREKEHWDEIAFASIGYLDSFKNNYTCADYEIHLSLFSRKSQSQPLKCGRAAGI